MSLTSSAYGASLGLQAFPLSVDLLIKTTSFKLAFHYLPALGLVTAEAKSKPGNELLASMFQQDTGVDTPNDANHYTGDDVFVFDPKAAARPYRLQTAIGLVFAVGAAAQKACACCMHWNVHTVRELLCVALHGACLFALRCANSSCAASGAFCMLALCICRVSNIAQALRRL